jgi:CBS domain containing-hemolysin-like protein
MDLSALDGLIPRLVVMALLIVCAGFFAGSETALFSLSRVQRERLARSPSATDRYVATLLADPRRLIATLLIGSELLSITFAALAATVVTAVLPRASELVRVAATAAVALPILLILGEITPKTVALRTAERWAQLSARGVGAFTVLVTPLRVVLEAVAGLLARILGSSQPKPASAAIGEAEFRALVDAGSAEGALAADERRLIHNVFAFGDKTVAEIMTDASKVVSLSYDLPIARLAAEVAKTGLSRIPIHRGRKEEVIGILYAKDLVGSSTGRLKGRTVKDLLRPPMYVPKTTKCDRVFREFQRQRMHLAMVVDEYGRLVGLVTMEDLLVSLFGPIRDEKSLPDPADEAGTSALLPPAGAGGDEP